MIAQTHDVRDRISAVTGVLAAAAAMVLPFAALEFLHAPAAEAFPGLLFVFMSIHATLIAAAWAPAVRHARRTGSLRGLRPISWGWLALGILLMAVYFSVLADQMPCFLGVPNCD